jgi:carboxyl-terminal processing protease
MRSVLKVLIVVLLAMFLMASAFVAGFCVNLVTTRAQAAQTVSPQDGIGLLWEVWNIIKAEYYGDIPNAQARTHGAIRGMLSGLGDPHTVLVEPDTAKNEQANLQGNTGDVGLNLDMRNRALVVVSPLPNSPADKAGLRAGDIIVQIGGKDLAPDITVQSAQTLLRGPIGSKLALTVHRPGESKPLTVEMTREKYALPTVQAKVLPGTTFGLIQVSMETAETSKEFARALDGLKSQKVTGLVLDLRNNPGGLFPDPVLDIAGEFLKNNDIVLYEKYRDGSEKPYRAGNRHGAVDLPLAVLVNGGTASDAEILAGALKDYKRGVIIGERTFGKGSVQVVRQLSDGAALHITAATWFTPKRAQIEGQGLQPDIAVAPTGQDSQKAIDPQLDRAIQYLKTGA